ncbi:hypothetical protein A5634_20335 [Mycobacterium asiaticum]|uniref:Uncharacterized protein n=1 Tax=Mycobacterium asiaticum TaxID=1790 RepID=A0A1A3P2X3_MYCAS|nr:hypothetical protein A5634_20335 [Mycobacterium asiaticum]
MTADEISIIAGNAKNVGLRATGEPATNAAAVIANVTTAINAGARTTSPDEADRGASGGAAISMTVVTVRRR